MPYFYFLNIFSNINFKLYSSYHSMTKPSIISIQVQSHNDIHAYLSRPLAPFKCLSIVQCLSVVFVSVCCLSGNCLVSGVCWGLGDRSVPTKGKATPEHAMIRVISSFKLFLKVYFSCWGYIYKELLKLPKHVYIHPISLVCTLVVFFICSSS